MLAELVEYDPEDESTYPSICQTADQVYDRFGFEGGETLLFDNLGNYVGQVVKRLLADEAIPPEN